LFYLDFTITWPTAIASVFRIFTDFYAEQNADTPQSIGNLIISTQNDVIENFDDEIDYFTNVRFCVK